MAEPFSSALPSDIRAFEREWTALRECISPWRNAQALPKLLRSVDWSRLLVLAKEHGVLGQLAACLNNETQLVVPPEVQRTLLERLRAQNFLTLHLTAELLRLLESFHSGGIPALAIKGPVLAVQAYADPSVRKYGDVDLLVRQQDIRRATELMIASGYQAAIPLNVLDTGRIPGQYLFSKADSNLLVELHNDLTLRYFPRPLPLEDFFAREIRVRLDPHAVPAPSVEDHLVLVCVHGAKHLWERLSWIADVAGIVARQKNIDWERAASTARAVQSEHLLHTGLRLAVEVLHAKLPEAISSRLQGDAAARKLATGVLRWLPAAGYPPPGLLERAAFRLRMRGNLLAAPAYLLRLSLSPTEEDWQAGGQLVHNRFLDMMRRPFRLAKKYSRGSKS